MNKFLTRGEFLSFSADKISEWLIRNLKNWIKSHRERGLFTPYSVVMSYDTIYEGFEVVSKGWNEEQKRNFYEGMKIALERLFLNIENEEDRECIGHIIKMATYLKEFSLQIPLFFHIKNLRQRRILFWKLKKLDSCLFDLILDYIRKVPFSQYSPKILKQLDNNLNTYLELKQCDYDYDDLNRLVTIFVISVNQLSSEEEIKSSFESFVLRVNKVLYDSWNKSKEKFEKLWEYVSEFYPLVFVGSLSKEFIENMMFLIYEKFGGNFNYELQLYFSELIRRFFSQSFGSNDVINLLYFGEAIWLLVIMVSSSLVNMDFVITKMKNSKRIPIENYGEGDRKSYSESDTATLPSDKIESQKHSRMNGLNLNY